MRAAFLKVRFDFLERFALGFRQQERRGEEIDDREAGKHEEHRGVVVLADERQEDGRRMAETSWLMTSATLMPLERMRVGMSSESASQTQTPGPMA